MHECPSVRDDAYYRDLGQRLRAEAAHATSALERIALYELPEVVRRLRASLPLGHHDWEDIAQGALDRIWRARAHIDPERFSRGYLHRVVRNAALDLLKRRRSGSQGAMDGTERSASVDEVASPPSELEGHLRRILARFSEVDRRILRAYADSGGAGDWASRVASELGMQPGTVRVRKLRGVRRIRDALGRLGYDLPESEIETDG